MKRRESFAPKKSLGDTLGVAKCKEIFRDKKEERTVSEENKDKARRLVEEAFGQGKLEVVDEVLDPDFVCYDPNSEAGEVREADNIRQEIEWFRNAVPD